LEVGGIECCTFEERPSKIGDVEMGPSKVGGRKDGEGEFCPGHCRPAKVRPAEIRPAEIRNDEPRPEEVRPFEVRPFEVRPLEVRPWFDRVAVHLHAVHTTDRPPALPERPTCRRSEAGTHLSPANAGPKASLNRPACSKNQSMQTGTLVVSEGGLERP